MACVTIFTGEGGNCNNGLGLGNFGSYRFPGYWLPTQHIFCGHSWLAPKNGAAVYSDPNNWSFYAPTLLVTYEGCNDSAPGYDCINGGCLPKATYGTPGIFTTLAACTSGCAKNSNCQGECISAEEIAALSQAANSLKSKICG
jgi:hypothetical protein